MKNAEINNVLARCASGSCIAVFVCAACFSSGCDDSAEQADAGDGAVIKQAANSADKDDETRADDRADAGEGESTATAEAQEEALREQVEALWQAQVEDDWETVHSLLSPQDRETKPIDKFIEWSKDNHPFRIESFEISNVIIDDGLGWVTVDAEQRVRKFPDLPAREAPRQELWELQDGRWYPVDPAKLENYPESPAKRDLQEEERLTERFEQAWAYRESGDWRNLYEVIVPKMRNRIPPDDFVEANNRNAWLDYELHWVQVIGDTGTVNVTYRIKSAERSTMKAPPVLTRINERWQKIDGEWFLFIAAPE